MRTSDYPLSISVALLLAILLPTLLHGQQEDAMAKDPGEGSSVVVARLTKFSGEQSFELPSNIDLSRYSHLVLWCKKYSVAMGIAKLEDPEGHKEHQ
jgi:hypothetical protein